MDGGARQGLIDTLLPGIIVIIIDILRVALWDRGDVSVHWSSPQLVAAKLKALVAGNKTKKFNTASPPYVSIVCKYSAKVVSTITRHLLDDQNPTRTSPR